MYQRSTACRYPCGEGGDSGPTNRRMSTTTSGPFTRVVRRMIPSGSVNCGVPDAGVAHPSTHVPVGGPLVAGGTAGTAGGVGEAVGDASGTGETGAACDGVGAASGAGASPSHATSGTARTHATIRMSDLRKRSTPGAIGNDTRIPIARFLGRTD